MEAYLQAIDVSRTERLVSAGLGGMDGHCALFCNCGLQFSDEL